MGAFPFTLNTYGDVRDLAAVDRFHRFIDKIAIHYRSEDLSVDEVRATVDDCLRTVWACLRRRGVTLRYAAYLMES